MKDFKVGQRVRVRQWADMAKEFGTNDYGNIKTKCSFTPPMSNLCGRTATIKDIYKSRVKLDFDNKSGCILWDYSTDMLEPLNFTKADLENGMVLETRDGKRYFYLNGNAHGEHSWIHTFDRYNEDLTYTRCDFDGALDIIKVFKVNNKPSGCLERLLDDDNLNLIWERKEEPKVKEVTVEEAAELLKEKFSDFDKVKIVV